MVPHIEPFWREHQKRRYVESFCGGLAVALGLKSERAVLNDLNPHLINFYAQLRRGLSVKIEARYDGKLFYAHRERFTINSSRMATHKPGKRRNSFII